MGMKVFRFGLGERCGGCNWRVDYLYVIASNKEEAEELLKREEGGLCGDCLCELLVDTQAEVVFNA